MLNGINRLAFICAVSVCAMGAGPVAFAEAPAATSPSPGAEDAARRTPPQAHQPVDAEKPPAAQQAARRQPATFATDPTTDANCYIVFGDLRCSRTAVASRDRH